MTTQEALRVVLLHDCSTGFWKTVKESLEMQMIMEQKEK